MSSFHRCMRKKRDGSNRITEKNKLCLSLTISPFWKKIEDVLKSGLTPKNKNKSSLRSQNLIGNAGEEVEKIPKVGSRQTTRKSIL